MIYKLLDYICEKSSRLIHTLISKFYVSELPSMDGATSSDVIKDDISDENGSSQKLECAICLQPYVQPVELPCHHTFCYLCVKGIAQQSKRCAMCRQEIPVSYLDNPQLIAVKEPVVSFEGAYQWYYQGHGGWWQYDDRTSMEIEAAYKRGDQQCEVLIAGFLYVIDFQNNCQVRRSDPSRRRVIKRDLVSIPKLGIAGIRCSVNSSNNEETELHDLNRAVSLFLNGTNLNS